MSIVSLSFSGTFLFDFSYSTSAKFVELRLISVTTYVAYMQNLLLTSVSVVLKSHIEVVKIFCGAYFVRLNQGYCFVALNGLHLNESMPY